MGQKQEVKTPSAGSTSALQTAGTIAVVTGAIGALVTTVAAVLWRIETAHPMPFEIVLMLLGVSGGAVGFGLLERINRPTRTAVLRLVARVDEIHAQVADIEQAISRVPAYGQGVIDGIQMHQSAGVPHHD